MTEKKPFAWETAIAWKNKDRIVVRGYDVNELTGSISFAEHFHLVLRGELPTPEVGRMTDAIMVNMAEHAMSPSSATVRFATSGGAELNSAVAAGVAGIGKLHGTADRPAELFLSVARRAEEEGISDEEAAGKVVAEMRAVKERMPGFHHAQHIRDPRTVRLMELSDKLGITGRYVTIARAMEDATEEVFGRRIWINGPGSMGCIGLDMGYEPLQLKALFIVCRSLSLCAHSIEEMTREKGWRASSNSHMVQPLDLAMQGPDNYDGPEDRTL
ncbi:hypothetical protein OIE66_07515 [Nonomuraea sp. NBC_01738]|uniref:citrate/2-methylcitrate synthase n=1 Tax=Nonomuraea sp. NBC_01738 TaxID=2976003 RepID=UPI002E0D3020|nr:hypothetical protein OIE66_07515 [Nonomuraea sp. NBC_01738]